MENESEPNHSLEDMKDVFAEMEQKWLDEETKRNNELQQIEDYFRSHMFTREQFLTNVDCVRILSDACINDKTHIVEWVWKEFNLSGDDTYTFKKNVFLNICDSKNKDMVIWFLKKHGKGEVKKGKMKYDENGKLISVDPKPISAENQKKVDELMTELGFK